MTYPSPLFYLTFAVTALIIGLGKGGFGSSFAALATPRLALTMPVPELVPLMLPFLMVGDIFAVGFHWRRWDRRQVLLLIPGALVGVAVGTLFLTNVSPDVLRTFLKMGGGMVDSSPMYGSAEQVLGYTLERIDDSSSLFSATKIWTPFTGQGISQIMDSHEYWGLEQFDLLQVHNLLNWEKHLETLLEWKSLGLTRYVGITTSHGRRHDLFEKVMTTAPIDFVQFTYNIVDRAAEDRLLPIARERELGVIINRPFQGGQLFPRFEKLPLPAFAKTFDCRNWAQFFLKFIVSHPAVTCAIPATSRVDHMIENMGALEGRLPDEGERRMMIQYIASL